MGYLTYQKWKIVLPEGGRLTQAMLSEEGAHYPFQLDGYDTERDAVRAMDKAVEDKDEAEGAKFTIESYYEVRYAN